MPHTQLGNVPQGKNMFYLLQVQFDVSWVLILCYQVTANKRSFQ